MSLVDLRIDVDDFVPKVSVGHRRSNSLPNSPSPMINGCSGNWSFSYNKLPEEPLKLSVLKLDGSCFEIEVMKSATVADLRHAVEAVFCHRRRNGPAKISWSHVWGHFCLCYNGQKLVTETDYIRDYGIWDGDELQFVRHISSNYCISRRRSMKQLASLEQQHKISISHSNSCHHVNKEEDEHCAECKNKSYTYYCDTVEEEDEVEDDDDDDEARLVRFIKWWFPYSKLPTGDETRSLKTCPSSRSLCGFFRSLKKIIQFCGNNPYQPWRED